MIALEISDYNNYGSEGKLCCSGKLKKDSDYDFLFLNVNKMKRVF